VARRALFALAVGAALAALLFSAASLAGAPVSLRPPRVASNPWPSLDFVVRSTRRDWQSQKGAPVHFSYSWLRCDLRGKHCGPLRGLHSRRIVPPQELKIISVRAVVTASNEGGSTTAVSRNFYFDEAGRARSSRRDLYPLVYDPLQLRHWYGLRRSQNGAGQTIVITAFWRSPRLVAAVDRFSRLYGLPVPCYAPDAGTGCFTFEESNLGPSSQQGAREDEDVEWVHAIAPKASIVVVRSRFVGDLLADLTQEGNDAHVFSASWGYRGEPTAWFERLLFFGVGAACHRRHVVCTFPSGDRGSPGDRPANSPDVLAVGGTLFKPQPDGATRSEAYWPYGGFGVTKFPQRRPSWQKLDCRRASSSCAYRVVPDVSATAENVGEYEFPPGTPNERAGWFFGGGTSLSSPLWAALIALADQQLARDGQPAIGIDELHVVLYHGGLSAGLDDLGHPGWSSRTGWGAPKAGIVDVLVRAIERYRASH
jgi:hypothetical protein